MNKGDIELMWQSVSGMHLALSNVEISCLRMILKEQENREVKLDYFDDAHLDYDVDRVYLKDNDTDVYMETNDGMDIPLRCIPEPEIAIIFQVIVTELCDNEYGS